MRFEIQINNSPAPQARYLSWAPSPCRIRVTEPSGIVGPSVRVRIQRRVVAGGGSVEFATAIGGPYSSVIPLQLSRNGTSVRFYARGVFGRPSVNDRDIQIDALARVLTILPWRRIASVPVMVRVRKNARVLQTGERERLLAAFAQLNNQGLGRFSDFRDMHVDQATQEAHGRPGFLPWHRAYLLDLERELQAIDPSVSLPYWRFDQPAPELFTEAYFGFSQPSGTVTFSADNPLQFWRTDGAPGILRRPFFPTNQAPAGLRTEAQTLALGATFPGFRSLEGNPHGSAHTSFGGYIGSINTAARDPLFFLLHCNVDRIWAKWQNQNGRYDPDAAGSYDTNNPGNKAGHNLPDTMWPWNGIINGGRPPVAPGGTLASSITASAPGPQPRVRDCFDYQGSLNPTSRLGFSYDDVA